MHFSLQYPWIKAVRGNRKINEVLHLGLCLTLKTTFEASFPPSQQDWLHLVLNIFPCNILEALEANLISRRGRTTLQSTRHTKEQSAKPGSDGEPKLLWTYIRVSACDLRGCQASKTHAWCLYPFTTACRSAHQSHWTIFGLMLVTSPICHAAGHAAATHPEGEVGQSCTTCSWMSFPTQLSSPSLCRQEKT